VRAKLLAEKTQLEASVEKRKQREIKKYGKEVQRKRTEEKQQSKKVQLDAVKKWRQDRKQSGGGDAGGAGEDFDVGILDEAENKVSKKRKADSPAPNQSRKRQAKDQKFGFGGKKRGSKRNTAESTADMSGGFGRGAPRCEVPLQHHTTHDTHATRPLLRTHWANACRHVNGEQGQRR
jgi:rRNA-processing protein EBP2